MQQAVAECDAFFPKACTHLSRAANAGRGPVN